jgi:hypothetical protein
MDTATAWKIDHPANTRPNYVATGVGAGQTGRSADLLLIDDPIKNPQEAFSQTSRQHIWDWYLYAARTRLKPDGAIS